MALAPPSLPSLSSEDLRAALAILLPSKGMDTTTPRHMRENLEDHFGLPRGSFEARQEGITEILRGLVTQIPSYRLQAKDTQPRS